MKKIYLTSLAVIASISMVACTSLPSVANSANPSVTSPSISEGPSVSAEPSITISTEPSVSTSSDPATFNIDKFNETVDQMYNGFNFTVFDSSNNNNLYTDNDIYYDEGKNSGLMELPQSVGKPVQTTFSYSDEEVVLGEAVSSAGVTLKEDSTLSIFSDLSEEDIISVIDGNNAVLNYEYAAYFTALADYDITDINSSSTVSVKLTSSGIEFMAHTLKATAIIKNIGTTQVKTARDFLNAYTPEIPSEPLTLDEYAISSFTNKNVTLNINATSRTLFGDSYSEELQSSETRKFTNDKVSRLFTNYSGTRLAVYEKHPSDSMTFQQKINKDNVIYRDEFNQPFSDYVNNLDSIVGLFVSEDNGTTYTAEGELVTSVIGLILEIDEELYGTLTAYISDDVVSHLKFKGYFIVPLGNAQVLTVEIEARFTASNVGSTVADNLSPYEQTEDSLIIKDIFDSIKGGNYTATISNHNAPENKTVIKSTGSVATITRYEYGSIVEQYGEINDTPTTTKSFDIIDGENVFKSQLDGQVIGNVVGKVEVSHLVFARKDLGKSNIANNVDHSLVLQLVPSASDIDKYNGNFTIVYDTDGVLTRMSYSYLDSDENTNEFAGYTQNIDFSDIGTTTLPITIDSLITK